MCQLILFLFIALVLIYVFTKVFNKEEHLMASSDGGALIQLAATGAQDMYLTGVSTDDIIIPYETSIGSTYPEALTDWY
jgi:hypothetical protein